MQDMYLIYSSLRLNEETEMICQYKQHVCCANGIGAVHFCSCQVVYQCCEEGDPSSTLETLMSRVKEGQLSEGGLLRLLRTVQQKAPSSFPPPLRSLLEEVEGNTQEPQGNQTGGKEEHFVH